MAERKNKITKFPNRLQRLLQDSGILLFTIIALYMIVCFVIYLSKDHISVYEVVHGSISRDYSYTGIALRTEQVVLADRSGYITYYAREGEKVGAKTTVCAIDETGQIASIVEQAATEETVLTTEDILDFKEEVQSYQQVYDNQTFDDIYAFKQNLEGSVMETVHLKMLNTAAQSMDNSALLNIYSSAADGILSYKTDGLESLTREMVTKDLLKSNPNKETDLKKQSLVNPSDVMYKLITEDNWSVVVSMDRETAKELKKEEYVEITFLKDNQTAWGQVDTWEGEDATFVQFSFNNSMVRYASERYLDIRFQLNDMEGLKIPVSAVAEEEFYVIPVEYVAPAANDKKEGVYLLAGGADGTTSNKFQAINVVKQTEDAVYVSKSDFAAGQTIQKPGDSPETYAIGQTQSLQGVYCINKGFTVFCPIVVKCVNKEYCIADSASSGGLSQYDRIVLEAQQVENDRAIY